MNWGKPEGRNLFFFPLSLVDALAKLFFLQWLHAAASPSSSQAAVSLQEDKRGNNCFSEVQIFKVCLSDSSLRQLLSNRFLQQPLGQSSCSQCLPDPTTSPTRLHPSTVSHHPASPSITESTWSSQEDTQLLLPRNRHLIKPLEQGHVGWSFHYREMHHCLLAVLEPAFLQTSLCFLELSRDLVRFPLS